MKVYIAGSSRELARVRAVADAIDAMPDMEITERWWVGAEAWAGLDSEQSDKAAKKAALSCIGGVSGADVLVMLMPSTASGGSMVELGLALGLGTPIIVSDTVKHRTVFCSLAEHVVSDELVPDELRGGAARLVRSRSSGS